MMQDNEPPAEALPTPEPYEVGYKKPPKQTQFKKGESGNRNVIRGDGFFGWDEGLEKSWKTPYAESHVLRFRWEVFNVPNANRFNVQSNPPELDQISAFGNYTGLLTDPRVMQFALRYEF